MFFYDIEQLAIAPTVCPVTSEEILSYWILKLNLLAEIALISGMNEVIFMAGIIW